MIGYARSQQNIDAQRWQNQQIPAAAALTVSYFSTADSMVSSMVMLCNSLNTYNRCVSARVVLDF